jgi:GTP cyclohydrolase I
MDKSYTQDMKRWSSFTVVPELMTVIGQDAVYELLMTEEARMNQVLKKCFHALMTCPKEIIETQLQILQKRLVSLGKRRCVSSLG